MSRLRATDPVRVIIGECGCPDTPHTEDEAWLPPRLGVESALEAMAIIYLDEPEEVITRKLGMVFMRCVTAWNLIDEDGPIPLSAMFDGSIGWADLKPIADKASDLYTEELMAPFQAALPKSSQRGRTGVSTSRRKRSTSGRRKR